ncbi:hypothetical protein ACFU99_01015 [Streptomyces sp. NPDC057654]|uniref:hypothetical protein n=1 Tax=Streptomyces sp. NPDC057654 TaxID=3346196 RepID=UPI0036A076FC
MDSTLLSTAATVAACIARLLTVRITTQALLGRARIEEEGRTARITALGQGGTLQERDPAGRQLAARQGTVAREEDRGPHGG